MKQVPRNLTADVEGFRNSKRYYLMDQDGKFGAAFRQILSEAGTAPVRLPPRSTSLNAQLERSWRSLRKECPDRKVFFG
jgi:hypothetical protein